MNFNNYESAKAFLIQNNFVDLDSSFNLSKLCGQLLRKSIHESQGRDIAIRVKDAIDREQVETSTIIMWNDVLESAGLYPYISPDLLKDSSLLRYEYSKSPYLPNIYLHEKQHELSLQLQIGKAVIVSAPTSFGKSLLIEEVVASKLYKNLVIIQPTLALLDETRKKLLKYKTVYKLIVSTSQRPSNDLGNIFLFTGERVLEYTEFTNIEFFVIDEFYKLSIDRDDDRAIALNQAFRKLLNFTSKFYMLGPMVKSIPISVIQRFELIWDRNEFATVAVDETNVEFQSKTSLGKRLEKKQILFDLVLSIKEPTLIYCSSPARCTELVTELLDYIAVNKKNTSTDYANKNVDMIEWIEENLNKEWILVEALRNSIAFHHGALPRHLGSSIVDSFNDGSIRFLFCTATLIEGVNTTAKNVLLFDKTKGTKDIDFFDYKNIAGRSGRMKEHYIGNVIRFEKEPLQLELDIDIPILTQDNAPIEILLSLNDNELKPNSVEKLKSFNQLPNDLKEVIKLNSSINVEGQLAIIKEIEANVDNYFPLLSWSQSPNFEQLALVIKLGWDHFANPNDKTFVPKIGRLSSRWLTTFVFAYIINRSVGKTIVQVANQDFWIEKIPDLKERLNIATFTTLQISRHWFDYKLPKWLNVVSTLQDYVLRKNNLKPGSYAFLASSLENGFLNSSLAAIREYDIPITAIRKLQSVLDQNSTPESNIIKVNSFSDTTLRRFNLINYEINKIRGAL